jgi:hypothetical protein
VTDILNFIHVVITSHYKDEMENFSFVLSRELQVVSHPIVVVNHVPMMGCFDMMQITSIALQLESVWAIHNRCEPLCFVSGGMPAVASPVEYAMHVVSKPIL